MKTNKLLFGEKVGVVVHKEHDRVYCCIDSKYRKEIPPGMLLLIKTNYQQRKIGILTRVDGIYISKYMYLQEHVKDFKEHLELSKYKVLHRLSIIGAFVNNQFLRIIIQPNLGDNVYTIKDSAEVLNLLKHKNELYIDLGVLLGYRKLSIPLKAKEIFNHCTIIGKTKFDGSYTAKYLIKKLSQIDVNNKKMTTPIVIIDTRGDYYELYEKFRKGKLKHNFGNIRRLVFENSKAWLEDDKSLAISIDFNSLNPLDITKIAANFAYISEYDVEEFLVMQEFFKILYYYGDVNYYLEDKNRFEYIVNKIHEQLKVPEYEQIIDDVMKAIKSFGEIIINNNLVTTTPSLRHAIINNYFIDRIVKNNEFVIFDFSPESAPYVSITAKILVISCFITSLIDTFLKYKLQGQSKNLILIIEDAHEYLPRFYRHAALLKEKVRLITKSKDLGIGLILVTHSLSKTDLETLRQIGTWIFHHIPTDIKQIFPEEIRMQLDLLELQPGTIAVVGRAVPIPSPVCLYIIEKEKI